MDYLTPRPDLYNIPFTNADFQGMPFRRLGGSGLQVSAVGLGTWKLGLPETGDGARVGEAESFALFDRAVELGVTFWDTANRYNAASGNSERVIGRWLRHNGDQRRNIVLATKLCGAMDGITPNHSGLSRLSILDSVEASLERLQTNRIDLLYFHQYDAGTPVEESLLAIEDLVVRGTVRYFAVSNFTIAQLEQYRQASPSLRSRFVAVQNQFDLLHGEQPARAGVLDYCAACGASFIAWSPLARGLLTDRYLDLANVGPGDRLYDEGVADQISPADMDKLHRLSGLARKWEMPLSELVIAYMLSLPGMGPVIPSATSIRQLESNAAGGKLILQPEQSAAIREVLA
ncbi:aldo/keto reductase [Paenibacillus koleovorans]|uniref:aldo/keto reductase n=1 Tax=Paenibacillus koleovorans TaxID=121608 RepID=UPI000FD8AD31|nr:aldo/keto reductase [Paenibacillus koleovorans]